MDYSDFGLGRGELTRRRLLRASMLLAGAAALHGVPAPVSALVRGGPAAPPATGQVLAVAIGSRGLVAVGVVAADQPAMWTSHDGGSWEQLDLDERQFTDAEIRGVTWHGDRYVAVGSTVLEERVRVEGFDGDEATEFVRPRRVPAAWLSADGRRWQRRVLDGVVAGNARLAAAKADGHLVVAVGSHLDDDSVEGTSGLVLVSPDGGTWSQAPTPSGTISEGSLTGVARIDGIWMAVGGDLAGPIAWRSHDGRSWTVHTACEDALAGLRLHDVIDDSGVLVAGSPLASQEVRQYRSDNGGGTWRERHLALAGVAASEAIVTGFGRLHAGGEVVAIGSAAGAPTLHAGVARVAH